MKKKLVCAVFPLFAYIASSAQQENKNGSIELTFGASIPISQYADGETGRHISGFTKTGQALTISYYHPTKKKVGFMATFLGQWNPLNTGALEDRYSNSPFYSLIFAPGPSPNPNPPPAVYYKN
ncbi:MAG TPA: hypothetical protein VEV87_07810, partial [Chitinophagaceae bacterium]|nr:hypothetical protein [Chitinophagaceae bacterium]